ncbi:MAG: hypothetical protein M0R17_13625 [Candidatus Omnitrophica bacterium]|jgi:cytoskeletal protein RodZ|nr:hypothetical protein [Candidatus Omnitrophota bacterium]MDD5253026.1 hypothetical protein [Candidatus Omnitrophota bacterium]
MRPWAICNKTRFRKGQNLAETALIIILLGLALLGMQVYVKRGLQGNVKDLTDNIIGTEQEAYQQDTSGLEINNLTSTLTSDSVATTKEFKGGGRSLTTDETTTYEYGSTTKGN